VGAGATKTGRFWSPIGTPPENNMIVCVAVVGHQVSLLYLSILDFNVAGQNPRFPIPIW